MRTALADDVSSLVAIPSFTGDEREALQWLSARAIELGLRAALVPHDLGALRRAPGYPGEEAPRRELLGLEVRRSDAPERPARRLALCGHVDVVSEGSAAWSHERGAVDGGYVWGRGSADMKGGVIAALHALATATPPPDLECVLLAVSSEEDGGLGAFAALERDSRWDACVIPEPTNFDVVCAQAGALTFAGVVRGRAAHAALRRAGISAIDRYIKVHLAVAAHEDALNADVEHPLMREVDLPYPVLVGRIAGGDWSSSVPDRLEFEGRLGVRVGESLAAARDAFERRLRDATGDVELEWTGGQFGTADTPADHPLAQLALRAVGDGARPIGVPYGADMRLFAERGIPTVMVGTGGLDRAHGVDERVAIADVERLTGVLRVVIEGF
jgi:acetylornithine deacetylase